MILADVLADYEKQLEAVGEEPEALSFVYRGLKQWDLTHLCSSIASGSFRGRC